jgi:hypothetical protein
MIIIYIFLYNFASKFNFVLKLVNQSEKKCYYWNVNACSKRCIRKLL